MTTYEKRRSIDVGDKYDEERAYTNIDFFMGVIAIFGLLIIGMRHLDTWGWVNLMEGFMALAGILGLNLIKNRDFRIMRFKRFSFYSFPKLLVMLMGVVLVQVISRLPFTMDNIDLALTIVFAAVAEELFFRGFIISIFLEVQDSINPPDKEKIKDIIVFGKTNLNFGIVGIIGVIVSSIFFAAIHTNYYEDPRMMIAVFVGGLVFGFGYMLWEDMTANILAHFILNVIAVYQSGLLVNLSGSYGNPISVLVILIVIINSLFIFKYLHKRKERIKDGE